ncbi:MAG: sensor histidine kinase [Acidobacteria bacterium]|nr:sensor histidine kinase [Acidobacteriota bacterium]
MQKDDCVRIRPLAFFLVATGLTFFSSFQSFYFVSTFTEKPAPFGLLFVLNLGYWYSWACLAPGIFWLSRRFPLDKQHWRVSLPMHLMGVFVATTLHVAMSVATRVATYWTIGESTASWLREAQRMFFLNFDWEMMTYWAIVGLCHALAYRHVAQARALRASQLETRLVEAQLQSLQRQLQPHFLFNTLNTISALMHRDVEAADAMIARLSDLLRISLQMVGVQEVSLKEELDFLSKYLEIEQTRFRDRLTVVFDVQPDTFDALVPNLILQPLVENAIKHGIGPRPAPGTITIRSRRVGGMLELNVQDNGVGLSAARLSDFNRGVGLSNTRARLEHLYGSLHRFEFRQPPEGGLLVLIAVPLAEVAEEVVGVQAVEGAA